MKLADIKKNYLGIEKPGFEKAQIIIAPFGFEATTTYGKGTKNGPAAILKASQQVELFDEELWHDISKKVKIGTLENLKVQANLVGARKVIKKTIGEILKNKKLPIVLGGEHSITPLIIENYIENSFKDFSVLQFDAHTDLRDGYLGKKFSHAAAMRRCLDFEGINLTQVGIRNISNENNELEFWESSQNRIKTFWAKDKKNWKIEEILKNLKENVYISFDVDAFDSSIMPATGTPQPGGIDWFEATEILREVCKNRKIIGADFVELAPIKNFSAPDFLVAKLIYKTIGYIFN